ncbi:MAG: Hsp70 family protein [Pirellulales bacterium]
MSSENTPAVGIDLGTTYSAVAYIDDSGRPVTLVNAEGDLVTPSVVLFEGNLPIVGKEAVKALATEGEHVAQCAKRELGERTFHKALQGALYPPEALQALVLNKLRQDAVRQIGEFSKVVITVPAYFDEVRRKATQDAGYMAGFEVLDIINEPTAAAIAHGFLKGLLNRQGESNEARKILVYDLGGGTFDVTVMEIRGSEFLALATDGDVQLGGQDWDTRLVNFVAEEFQKTFELDPREDPNAAGRLWRECEDAKRTLSARAKVSISCDYKSQAARVEITREKFEEITQDLLNRTEFTSKQTLQAAGLTWKDIDQVLMVGGSTRMPMVAAMLRRLTGKVPDASVSVDEAVAHGAALHAHILLSEGRGQRPLLRVKNVNSHSLGVVATDARTDRRRNAILIPRNTPLPVTAKRLFRTQKAGQKSILVQIVEGESASPDDCSQIGRCVARDLPSDLPAQTPIEVKFSYQENGRLTVNVAIAGTHRELRHEITRDNTMTQQQLDAWRLFVTGQGNAGEIPADESRVLDSQIGQAPLSPSGSSIISGDSRAGDYPSSSSVFSDSTVVGDLTGESQGDGTFQGEADDNSGSNDDLRFADGG